MAAPNATSDVPRARTPTLPPDKMTPDVLRELAFDRESTETVGAPSQQSRPSGRRTEVPFTSSLDATPSPLGSTWNRGVAPPPVATRATRGLSRSPNAAGSSPHATPPRRPSPAASGTVVYTARSIAGGYTPRFPRSSALPGDNPTARRRNQRAVASSPNAGHSSGTGGGRRPPKPTSASGRLTPSAASSVGRRRSTSSAYGTATAGAEAVSTPTSSQGYDWSDGAYSSYGEEQWPWVRSLSSEGYPYYYNQETGESYWEGDWSYGDYSDPAYAGEDAGGASATSLQLPPHAYAGGAGDGPSTAGSSDGGSGFDFDEVREEGGSPATPAHAANAKASAPPSSSSTPIKDLTSPNGSTGTPGQPSALTDRSPEPGTGAQRKRGHHKHRAPKPVQDASTDTSLDDVAAKAGARSLSPLPSSGAGPGGTDKVNATQDETAAALEETKSALERARKDVAEESVRVRKEAEEKAKRALDDEIASLTSKHASEVAIMKSRIDAAESSAAKARKLQAEAQAELESVEKQLKVEKALHAQTQADSLDAVRDAERAAEQRQLELETVRAQLDALQEEASGAQSSRDAAHEGVVAALRNQLEAAEKNILQLQESLSASKEEVAKAKAQQEDEREAAKAGHLAIMAAAEAQAAQELEETRERLISDRQQALQEQRTRLVEEHRAAMESSGLSHATALREASAKHRAEHQEELEAERKRLKLELEAAVQRVVNEAQASAAKAEKKHAEDLADAEAKHATALAAALAAAEEKHSSALDAAEARHKAALESKITEAKHELAAAVAAAEEKHAKSLQEAEHKHSASLAEAKSAHDDAMETALKEANEAHQKALEDAVAFERSERQAVEEQAQVAAAQATEKHASEISKLNEAHAVDKAAAIQAAIVLETDLLEARLRKEFDDHLAQTLEKERKDAQEKLELAVEECEASHQAEIVTLQTRVKVAEETLAEAVKSAIAETQRQAKEAAAKADARWAEKVKEAAHQATLDEQQRTLDEMTTLRAQTAHAVGAWQREALLRRTVHNRLVDALGNIRVFARVRPILKHEMKSGEGRDVTAFPDEDVLQLDAVSAAGRVEPGGSGRFDFDRVFSKASSQADVFEDVSPLVVSVIYGYSVCIFAYGQTGSGKTYTMEGPSADRGVNYRSIQHLFEMEQENSKAVSCTFSVSILEIYNEAVRDLLVPPPTSRGAVRKSLDIGQNERGETVVRDLTVREVTNASDVFACMDLASTHRAVGAHNVNERSSRSHLVVTIYVSSMHQDGTATHAKLNLIDLAGSERVSKTEAAGNALKEAQHINRSLSALGDVIAALGSKSRHVPFRNSKLTYLLQDSLSGRSKVAMFVNVSPALWNLQETLCSLKFALRCRKVQIGKAQKGTNTTDTVTALRRRIDHLELQLQYTKEGSASAGAGGDPRRPRSDSSGTASLRKRPPSAPPTSIERPSRKVPSSPKPGKRPESPSTPPVERSGSRTPKSKASVPPAEASDPTAGLTVDIASEGDAGDSAAASSGVADDSVPRTPTASEPCTPAQSPTASAHDSPSA